MRNLKLLAVVFFVVAIAPFIIMKLGFWDETFAKSNTPKYVDAYPPIANQQVVSYATAVERAAPAVVSIHPTKIISQDMNPILRDPFFRQFFGDMGGQNMPQEIQPSLGSGVIISKEGYILTNNHVIAGADEIKIKLVDGRSAQAKLIGTDPESDVAILKVDLPNLPVIAMGNSDTLKTGDVVLAIGNPFGVGQTVTQGIVSATQRTSVGINTFENFIQTDAPINPGNSGGALIDAYGNLVGINNAIITRSGGYQGIGFAIPVSLAKDVMAQLIETGSVTRGWLGITVMPLTDEARKSLAYPKGDGTVIGAVVRGGPAARAGLQPGDIIVSLDGEKTNDANGVLTIASRLVPEKAYPITVVRNNQTLDVRVVAGKRPGPVRADANPKPIGKSTPRSMD
jgi:Do/DeqQ family serine protease